MNKQVDYPQARTESWQRLWDMNNDPFANTQRLCRDFLIGSARAQNEAADYWNEACRSYVKALEKLGKCGSVEEVMAIQTDLANEAVTRFWDESRKATELMGEVISAVKTPGRSMFPTHHRV